MPTLADKVKMLVDWAPVLPILSEISAAATIKARVAGALKLMRFAATKTATPIDDDVLAKTEAVLSSPEGQALLVAVIGIVTSVAKSEIE